VRERQKGKRKAWRPRPCSGTKKFARPFSMTRRDENRRGGGAHGSEPKGGERVGEEGEKKGGRFLKSGGGATWAKRLEGRAI